MEQIFRKSEPDRYPQKVFANQLITVDDFVAIDWYKTTYMNAKRIL